ncbi:MAG: tRNA (adenosine(37)-N6)-dimethylallyltransferase MiaA [Pseudomonadota bacterium]|nr:tRNA (adenosine(37)-N6)-dimethylallyltransferase MiaA [Pseudomonadota bacterium]
MTKKCFILYGPTASGKSKIAYELAQELPIEIVNMDSVQVFNDFNIGAAKPDQSVLNQVPHHLINIVSVPDHFSVATYLEKLNVCLEDIHSRHKLPLLVGGTMLYLKAIMDGGLSDIPLIDHLQRDQIHNVLYSLTQKQRYDLLIMVDSLWAKKVHPNDVQRTLRGLLVYFATNKQLSSHKKNNKPFQFKPVLMAIDPIDRPWLHAKINDRTCDMIESGLIEEVLSLIKRYPNDLDHFIFKSIGYKQVLDMIKYDHDDCALKEKINAATRQYAKRQMTWMKHHKPALTINPNQYILKNIKEWVISHSN